MARRSVLCTLQATVLYWTTVNRILLASSGALHCELVIVGQRYWSTGTRGTGQPAVGCTDHRRPETEFLNF
jgi:hypothetical protein